jgi:Cytosolic domain of 10TM putative phosphate transporter
LHQKPLKQVLDVQHREKSLREKHGDKFTPLTHRTGWCGICGARVESRRHYLAEIRRCESQIDEERHKTFNTAVANSFFVIFDSQARTLHFATINERHKSFRTAVANSALVMLDSQAHPALQLIMSATKRSTRRSQTCVSTPSTRRHARAALVRPHALAWLLQCT